MREPPLWGKCLTELTSEFTHFNLVIRLCKVKQPAFLFCTVLQCPAVPVVPGIPRLIACLSAGSRAEHPETFLSCSNFTETVHHITNEVQGRHMTCRCGLFSFGCLVR